MGCGATVPMSSHSVPTRSVVARGSTSSKMTAAQVKRATQLHIEWLTKTKKAIQTAESPTAEWDELRKMVSNPKACEFGKWLYLNHTTWTTDTPSWNQVHDIHCKFHSGVVKVLDVACGDTSRAVSLLSVGDIADISNELIQTVKCLA
ncbi:hypothetical protein Pelo_16838 [Pelomyxa schiedti]|nr:hypothetical protein Pelo_16838 [Pelomyxa schiedti]